MAINIYVWSIHCNTNCAKGTYDLLYFMATINKLLYMTNNRAAPIPSICIGMRPIPAFLMVSESVRYVPLLFLRIIIHEIVFLKLLS